MLDKGYNIEPLPKVEFVDGDSDNAREFLGKTAYYNPSNHIITLYTEGRHPKDIVRSFSHEMIHHIQNLEDRLGDIDDTNTMEDDHLNDIEAEANLKGTMTFRNWTDSLDENINEYENTGPSTPKAYIVKSDGSYKESPLSLLSKIPNLTYDMGGGETNHFPQNNVIIVDNIPVEEFAKSPGDIKDGKIYVEYNLNQPYAFPKAKKIIASQLVYHLDNIEAFADTVANSLTDSGTLDFQSDLMNKVDKSFLQHLSDEYGFGIPKNTTKFKGSYLPLKKGEFTQPTETKVYELTDADGSKSTVEVTQNGSYWDYKVTSGNLQQPSDKSWSEPPSAEGDLDYINSIFDSSEIVDYKLKTQNLNENQLNEIKDINNDIMLLEEGIKDLIKKGKEVTEEFLVSKIDPIVSKIIAAIKKGGSFVVNLIKKLFGIVERFREKHPILFKIVILLILMVLTMIFSSAAHAADPADLNYSTDALNTMVGLLDKIPSDVDIADKMEAKVYLKDLLDGNLSGTYGEGARNIASSIEVVYRDILQSAKDGDQGGMEMLLKALEVGKNTVMTTVGGIFKESLKTPPKHKHGFDDKLGKDPFGLNQYARELATGLEEEIVMEGKYDTISNKLSKIAFAAFKDIHDRGDVTGDFEFKVGNPEHGEDIDIESNQFEFDFLGAVEYTDGTYSVDGGANAGYDNDGDETQPMISLKFKIPKNPDWQEISFDIKDVVRHELEHLTQDGENERPGKYMEDDKLIRDLIDADLLPKSQYYKLEKEVDAMLQGLYFKAKKAKRPFGDVINDYLNIFIDNGSITTEEKDVILNIWRSRRATLSLPLFEQEDMKYKIYSDMDGVLTDFDVAFLKASDGILPSEYEKNFGKDGFWELIDGEGVGYWVGMPWMSDGKIYWDYIKEYNPTLLSSPSRSTTSRLGKRLWVKNNIPGTKLILAQAKDKQNYACKDCILIDDRPSNIDQWRSQGGIGILHISASDTIRQLKELGL
jgi:hypothetical protein